VSAPRVWQAQRLPGTVMLAGGTFIDAMGEEFVRLSGGREARLVIIPTAYGPTEEEGLASFVADWSRFGPASVDVVHTRDRAVADDPAFVAPLLRATGVWFCGGRQTRLLDTYKDTLLEQELHNVLNRGGAVGGNCAGAMALGELTIVRRRGGGVAVRPGFGIVRKLVMDSHWLERNRIERLRGIVEGNPGCFGLGVDSRTAVVLKEGQLRCLGNSYASTLVPATAPRAVQFDVWESGDEIDLGELFNPGE
jgi:cyanophycinase